MRKTKMEILRQDVTLQEKWIEQCGGTLAGYVANYHGIHGRTLDEAKAIFAADQVALADLQTRLSKIIQRNGHVA